MMRFVTVGKLALAILVVGLLLHFSHADDRSWAAVGQETERQTVPTRTPTPQPITPTTAPPTDTPAPPPPTDTPAPPSSVTRTPTLTPATTTPATTTPGTTTPTKTGTAPPTLPEAGGLSDWLAAGVFLTASGSLVVLVGLRQRRGKSPRSSRS